MSRRQPLTLNTVMTQENFSYPAASHAHRKHFVVIMVAIFVLLMSGCAKPRPDHTENICSIFSQYPEWYWDAKQSESKWGVPVTVQMSIINQESSFNAKAKPSRKKLLWVIPWKRRSTAYGYTQALNNTWAEYEQKTGRNGKRHAFADATDFVGWYANQARKVAGIPVTDPYKLYLAYHEGATGYAKQTYLAKPWLIKTAHKVSARSNTYSRQLASCERNIPKPGWWTLW